MAAFNTVPVEEDPLVEKAATKKTPWRRFVAMAMTGPRRSASRPPRLSPSPP